MGERPARAPAGCRRSCAGPGYGPVYRPAASGGRRRPPRAPRPPRESRRRGPWAWLPDETVATPRERSSSVSDATALNAPPELERARALEVLSLEEHGCIRRRVERA